MNGLLSARGCSFVLLFLSAASLASERVIYVDDDAIGANDGTSWTNAFVYLQDGVSRASASLPSRGQGDTLGEPVEVEIRVAQGTYRPHQATLGNPPTSSPAYAAFSLRGGLSIRGGYAGVGAPDPNERNIETYRTVLSGDLNGDDVEVPQPCDLAEEPTRAENSRTIVICRDTQRTPVLEGCVVTGATRSALENDGALVVSDCVFASNAGHLDGGAIHNQGEKLTLTRCTFTANWAWQFGGAIYADNRTAIVLTDCRFVGNQARIGGAVAGANADITLSGCMFEQNTARHQGAVCCRGGLLRAADCTFQGNSAPLLSGDGGALGLLKDVNATVYHCLFESNSAPLGGAVYGEGSELPTILQDCVFRGNSAGRGGALFGLYGSTVVNCIFAANRARSGGAADSDCTGPEFVNCTFVANRAENGNAIARNSCHGLPEQPIVMTNCILWDGGDEIATARNTHPVRYVKTAITFSDVRGGWPGLGNIDVDPCFADPGRWDENGTPDDPHDDLWVEGDYHLKSQAGRWDPTSESWILDDVTSPCIDAGDPASPVGEEPQPNGGRVNLGAYGGTTEASMSAQVGPTAGLWSEPVPLTEVNLGVAEEWSPSLSADGLTLYFGRVGRPDSYFGRIFRATRQSAVPYSRFAPVIELPGTLNQSVEHVLTPWVSADSLRMYYTHQVGSVFRLMVSERTAGSMLWPMGREIRELNQLDSRLHTCRLTVDELTIFYAGPDLRGAGAEYDIWTATRADRDAPFVEPVNVDALNSPANDVHATPSSDSRTLYFASKRSGRYQLFMSTWDRHDGSFGPPAHMALFDTPNGHSMFPCLSPDGSEFYFVRQTGDDRSTRDIWVSYRLD